MVEFCAFCGKPFRDKRALRIHASAAHGMVSDHPKTAANRRSSGPKAPHIAHQRRAEGVIDTGDRFADDHRPNGGPVALLEAVIYLARIDARHNPHAAAWLRDLRHALREY